MPDYSGAKDRALRNARAVTRQLDQYIDILHVQEKGLLMQTSLESAHDKGTADGKVGAEDKGSAEMMDIVD